MTQREQEVILVQSAGETLMRDLLRHQIPAQQGQLEFGQELILFSGVFTP